MEFAYDGDGLAKGGDVTLYIDGQGVGEGRIERTTPMPFSGDESLDLGNELGSLVTSDYGRRSSPAGSTGSRSTSAWTTTTT